MTLAFNFINKNIAFSGVTIQFTEGMSEKLLDRFRLEDINHCRVYCEESLLLIRRVAETLNASIDILPRKRLEKFYLTIKTTGRIV